MMACSPLGVSLYSLPEWIEEENLSSTDRRVDQEERMRESDVVTGEMKRLPREEGRKMRERGRARRRGRRLEQLQKEPAGLEREESVLTGEEEE